MVDFFLCVWYIVGMSERAMNRERNQIAKLMATENITVIGTKDNTASFNLETRVLSLPRYENLGDDAYNTFVAHEVGHALYTPIQYSEEIQKRGSSQAVAYTFNIVEDARIEKLIRRKYPGVVREFQAGYREFHTMVKRSRSKLKVDRYTQSRSANLGRRTMSKKSHEYGFINAWPCSAIHII
jgi:hypothetical protein